MFIEHIELKHHWLLNHNPFVIICLSKVDTTFATAFPLNVGQIQDQVGDLCSITDKG